MKKNIHQLFFGFAVFVAAICLCTACDTSNEEEDIEVRVHIDQSPNVVVQDSSGEMLMATWSASGGINADNPVFDGTKMILKSARHRDTGS